MDRPERVYWSLEQCQWVDCPPAIEIEPELPRQRTDEAEPAVLVES
jgi:hypothetical protein